MAKIIKDGVDYNSTNNMVELTQAEYNSLSEAQKMNGTFYFIKDADPSFFDSSNITYDGTTSGLTSDNVQEAIDETCSIKQNKPVVRSVSETTDNTGYFMVAFDVNVVVIAAWAYQGDCNISFFPSQGANEHGRINWWFRIMNESMSPRTNAPIDLYIMYITV